MEDPKFRVILGYIMNWRPAWTIYTLLSKAKKTATAKSFFTPSKFYNAAIVSAGTRNLGIVSHSFPPFHIVHRANRALSSKDRQLWTKLYTPRTLS